MSVAAAPFTAGASLLATTYVEDAVEKVGGAITGSTAMRKAAKQQEAQANALIAEQGKAAETAKENAVKQRRASMMLRSKTNYTTALGEYGQTESGTSVKKKTLLGG